MPASDLRLGRYRVLGPLGGGGSTQAYKAKSIGIEGFEKEVVLWRIKGTADFQSTAHETMIAEAKRAAFLSHADIAQVLDVGVEDGDCFVSTEYVHGTSLASLLARRAAPWPILVHIAARVANALDYAHARRDANRHLLGIVHRRVSPHRILLSTAGGVKLTGFGTTPPGRRCVAEHEWRYCSPEQRAGEPIDGRSDVYTLALILRESLPTDHPPEIDHALARALERYPEHRLTAGELRDGLRTTLHQRRARVRLRDVAEWARRSRSDSARAGERGRVGGGPDPAALLISAAGVLEECGAVYAAIDHLEAALESQKLDRLEDAGATLQLYERFGELCVRAHVGDRGASAVIAGLDLADGVGRDDSFKRLCGLLAELFAQADRRDESREWLERARRVARSAT